MTRYWIAVASKEHVQRGIKEGFMQVCHGKCGPLKRMAANDWVIYYSPKEKMGDSPLVQSFTAIGQVKSGDPYQVEMSPSFIPWRHDVTFYPAQEASILPLIEKLEFIKDKKRWGFPFRWGCFSISQSDFESIREAMNV